MANDFQLNPTELLSAKDWLKRHKVRCKKANKYSIRFSQDNGIGTAVEIKCSCGKIKDITDYGSW